MLSYMALAFASALFLLLVLITALGTVAPRAPKLDHVAGAQLVRIGDQTIRYHSEGHGKHALLLLHGFNNQLSAWTDVWPTLVDCGRRVRIDLPGFGGSSSSASSFSLEDQAARVIAFLDAVGIDRVTLVGVSMGGSLSAWIAAQYPERVTGLVLLAPSGYPESLRGRGAFTLLYGAGFFNSIATRLASNKIFRHLYPGSTALQALTVTASYGDAWGSGLERIRAHTYLLWSHGDATVPFHYADAVAASIPNSTLIPLPEEVGHDIPANRPELIGEIACQVHQRTNLKTIRSEQTMARGNR